MRKALALAALLLGAAVTALTPDSAVGRVVYLTCFGGIVTAAWLAVRRTSVGGRLPWVMLASAVTAWLAGDLVDAVMRLAGINPQVGPQDALWLAGYPLMGTAIIAMVRRRAPRQSRAAMHDGLALTTAAGLAAWQFLIAPALHDGGPPLVVIAGALYPVGDVALLAAVLYLVLSPGRQGLSTRLLVAGSMVTLVMDVAFTVLPNYWPNVDVDRLNAALLLANGMIVATALVGDRDVLVTPVRTTAVTLHPARVLFLGMALLTGPTMAVVRGALPMHERVLLLGSTGIVVAFCLARFTTAVREQARTQRRLAYLVGHDSLTGLANRHLLSEHLERDFEPRHDMVLCYLDLDGFKAVNDEHGHAVGDAVLVEAARRIGALARPGDLAARLGGDEFALFCPRLDGLAARRLRDQLKLALSAPITVNGLRIRVGASVGTATGAGSATGDDLLLRADHAMFDAKRAGRAHRPAARRSGVSSHSPA